MLQITNTSKAFNNHFLKVSKSKGLFILERPNDEAEFDTVGGSVNRIETRIHKTKDGKEFILWHLLLNDEKIGDSYDISFPENSGLFGDMIVKISRNLFLNCDFWNKNWNIL